MPATPEAVLLAIEDIKKREVYMYKFLTEAQFQVRN